MGNAERQVLVFGLAEDGINESAVATQGNAEAPSATKDGSGAATDGRMFAGKWSVDERVFDAERALEGDESGHSRPFAFLVVGGADSSGNTDVGIV